MEDNADCRADFWVAIVVLFVSREVFVKYDVSGSE